MSSHFDRRLAAYSLTAGMAAVAGGATAHAAVVYEPLDPDVTLTYEGVPQSFLLDLNDDGTVDFDLRIGTQSQTSTTNGIQVTYYYREVRPMPQVWPSSVGVGTNCVLGDWAAKALNSNYLVGSAAATGSWVSYSGIWMAWQGSHVYSTGEVVPTEGGYFLGRNRKMLGLAFKLTDGWHYGWCRVSVAKDDRSFTVHDFAYEDQVDTPILTGAFLDPILPGTVGSRCAIDADDVADTGGAFTVAPKLVGYFFDPVKGKKTAKATFKAALSTPAPAPSAVFELKKKVKLYDSKAFKAAYKAGTSCNSFLNQQPNQGMFFNLEVQHAEGGVPYVGLAAHVALLPPEITDFAGGPDLGSVVTVTGKWFGVKAPKVWLEYRIPNPKGGNLVKSLKLKVLKPYVYPDAKGKADKSCMDVDTGESEIQVQFPDQWPKGWDPGNHFLVIDNGIGLTTGWDIDHLP